MKFTKKNIYIGLFSILYLIVAFSSFFHACAFFGLANNSWMSVILAFAFEVGQAAVLFSLLTSEKDRKRFMPWTLMFMFTLVQVIGNVYSSYKYIVLNSVDNLKYFKEPIFIWTKNLPDDQATVIIVYLVGALLPIAALLLTSMVTNYLSDQEALQNEQDTIDDEESGEEVADTEIDGLKKKLEETEIAHDKLVDEKSEVQKQFNSLLEDYSDQNKELAELKKELEELKKSKENIVDEEEENDEVLLDGGRNDSIQQKEEDVEQSTTEEDKDYDDVSDEYIEEPDGQESNTGESEPEIDKTIQDGTDNNSETTEEKLAEEPVEENIPKRESHFINL
jgi:hypothetical protein